MFWKTKLTLYRKWKTWADAAAPPNLMAYLFAKDNVLQSLRLGFAGAWAEAFPDLSDPLNFIESHCPLLIRSFVPPSERQNDDDGYGLDVWEDVNHSSVKVDVKGYQATRKPIERLLLMTNSSRCLTTSRHSPMILYIRQAFAEDYNIRNILQFNPTDRILWYQRVAFTDSVEKRRIFRVGDFCRLQSDNTLCRIAQLAIVRFMGDRYLFFMAMELEETDMVDPVLDMSVYKMTERAVVFGLPRLGDERDYMLDAPIDGPWNDDDDGDREAGKGFFLRCPLRLEYI